MFCMVSLNSRFDGRRQVCALVLHRVPAAFCLFNGLRTQISERHAGLHLVRMTIRSQLGNDDGYTTLRASRFHLGSPDVRLPEQRIRESASLLLVNQRAPVPSWRSLSFVLPAKMREPRGWCGALSNRDQSDRLEFYTSPSWHPFASLRLRDSTHVWIAN